MNGNKRWKQKTKNFIGNMPIKIIYQKIKTKNSNLFIQICLLDKYLMKVQQKRERIHATLAKVLVMFANKPW